MKHIGVTEDASDDNVIWRWHVWKEVKVRETGSQQGWLNESGSWFQRQSDTHRKEQFVIFREKKVDGQAIVTRDDERESWTEIKLQVWCLWMWEAWQWEVYILYVHYIILKLWGLLSTSSHGLTERYTD